MIFLDAESRYQDISDHLIIPLTSLLFGSRAPMGIFMVAILDQYRLEKLEILILRRYYNAKKRFPCSFFDSCKNKSNLPFGKVFNSDLYNFSSIWSSCLLISQTLNKIQSNYDRICKKIWSIYGGARFAVNIHKFFNELVAHRNLR